MKGAIFDMDGVLFDTEALWQKCWNQTAAEMNLTLPEEFKKEVCGSSDKMPSVIQKYYHVDDPYPVILRTYTRLKSLLEEDLPEKEGLHEILPELKAMGFRIAVASSSDTNTIRSNLMRSNTLQYFDAITSGQEVKHGKPAPDIFLLAAEKLNLPIEECYVFEDAYNGIRAAAKANSKPIMVVDLSEPDEEMKQSAHFIVYSLKEALKKIKEEQ